MTKTEIINIALGRLGEVGIQSIDEGSAVANSAGTVYDSARRATLREYNWSFALREERLSRTEESRSSFYEYTFALPGDCLRIIRAVGNAGYETAGAFIHSNSPVLTVQYVADIEDAGLFDSKFIEALSYKLASELAMPVKGSSELMAAYNNAYLTLVRDSAAESASERRGELPDNPYIDARFA
jgi:hypothetical protein